MVEGKICGKCTVYKLAVDFYKSRATKTGLQHDCKVCRQTAAKKPDRECPRCHHVKPRADFGANRAAGHGLPTYCKQCVASCAETATPDATRRCAKCGESKCLEDFYKNPAGFDGRQRYCIACQKAMSQRLYAKSRKIVLRAYGGASPRCACCPEDGEHFLTMDHINNDGKQHRKVIGASANQLYAWLIRNGFPAGFQILCYNCNIAKQHYGGVCPHQIDRASCASVSAS